MCVYPRVLGSVAYMCVCDELLLSIIVLLDSAVIGLCGIQGLVDFGEVQLFFVGFSSNQDSFSCLLHESVTVAFHS